MATDRVLGEEISRLGHIGTNVGELKNLREFKHENALGDLKNLPKGLRESVIDQLMMPGGGQGDFNPPPLGQRTSQASYGSVSSPRPGGIATGGEAGQVRHLSLIHI